MKSGRFRSGSGMARCLRKAESGKRKAESGKRKAESGKAAYPPSRWRPAGGQLRYPHRGRGRRKNIKAVADDSARRLAGLKLQFDLKSEGVVRGGIRQAKQPGRVVADGLSGPS
jgi:hypothetical protein